MMAASGRYSDLLYLVVAKAKKKSKWIYVPVVATDCKMEMLSCYFSGAAGNPDQLSSNNSLSFRD